MKRRDRSTWLTPGTLWARVLASTERALQRGVLHSIPTRAEHVEDSGVRFLVRVAESLASKDEAKQVAAPDSDPFLPYDPELFVADLSDTHVCLLNKFNVVSHHVLIVTRAFEEQERLLSRADFEALWACMHEIDALGFYNGGEAAGASQRHKHLQMVPLPLAAGGERVPVACALADALAAGDLGVSPRLPFRHAFSRIGAWPASATEGGGVLHARYRELLRAVGLCTVGETERQSGPYNLLLTREWMLLAPRSAECFRGISVNALGFAGALLVRDEAQMALVKAQGPMAVLSAVGVSEVPWVMDRIRDRSRR